MRQRRSAGALFSGRAELCFGDSIGVTFSTFKENSLEYSSFPGGLRMLLDGVAPAAVNICQVLG